MMEIDDTKRRSVILCGCIAFVLIGLSFFIFDPLNFMEEKPEEAAAEEVTEGNPGGAGKRKILVYVVGAVKRPGVYEMPEGSHYYDAVRAAGDVLPYADMNGINMALPLTEATKIFIPLDPNQSDPAAIGLVNINTANEKELETLPGIGKVTADKIITFREENGLFESKEDLKKVPSISDGKFKKLADKITL